MMNRWKLVRLNFGKSNAHFGELGIGIEETSERVRSDTLFSALITAYAQLFEPDAVSNLLQQFLEHPDKPPFRLSSTFLYQQKGDKTIDYLPKPLQFPYNYPRDDSNFFKTYKKLNYLPIEIWRPWYQEDGFTSIDRNSDCAQLIQETTGQSSGNLREAGVFSYGKGFKKFLVPKISVDRITRATNLYHTGFVQFNSESREQSGLYFIIEFPQINHALESQLKVALSWLGEQGLGGERSSGAGQFKFKWFDFSQLSTTWQKVLSSPQLTHYTLISLFWESHIAESWLQGSSYEIQKRGGWIDSHSGHQLLRKSMQMFTEGSVFSFQPMGKLADVTPDRFKQYKNSHPIYRSGISLSLTIKLPNRQ